MIIAKIRCNCGKWIRLRAGGTNGQESETKTCWNCRPFSSKVQLKRSSGHPVGLVNDVVIGRDRFDLELDERN